MTFFNSNIQQHKNIRFYYLQPLNKHRENVKYQPEQQTEPSLEADDLLRGHLDQAVKVQVKVLPPEPAVSAVDLGGITGTSCNG